MRTVSRLPNSLRIVTDEMNELDTVALGAWVGVGSMYEPAEINGISHLLEHMVFKGTTTRSARQIAEEIENVGGYFNACTSRETTSFYIKVLKEDLPLAVDILADILLHSTFAPEEFDREKAVVLQEINQSIDTPDDIVFDYFQETAFPNQAFGRPVLGSVETVKGVSRETLNHYLKSNYTPDRTVLAASGNVKHDVFVSLVEKTFADLSPAKGFEAPQPSYVGGDFRQKKKIEQVNLILGFPSVTYYDENYYTAHLLSTVFGGGMSSRLFQEIREKRGLVYTVYSFFSPATKGGLFGVYAGTGEDEAAEIMPAVCDEIKKMQDSLTEEELNRGKAQLKAGILMSLEHPTARCEQNAGNLLIYDRLIEKDEVLDKINAVTPEQVLDFARKTFSQKPTFTALGPVKNVMFYDELCKALEK